MKTVHKLCNFLFVSTRFLHPFPVHFLATGYRTSFAGLPNGFWEISLGLGAKAIKHWICAGHATPQGLIGSKKVSTKTMHEGPYLGVLGG